MSSNVVLILLIYDIRILLFHTILFTFVPKNTNPRRKLFWQSNAIQLLGCRLMTISYSKRKKNPITIYTLHHRPTTVNGDPRRAAPRRRATHAVENLTMPLRPKTNRLDSAAVATFPRHASVQTQESKLHRGMSRLPRSRFSARRYASAVYAVIVCLSVCGSVTSRSSTKTAKYRITQTTPYDGPGRDSLVFLCQKSPRNSNGITPTGRQIEVGWVKTAIFDRYLAIRYLSNGARYGNTY